MEVEDGQIKILDLEAPPFKPLLPALKLSSKKVPIPKSKSENPEDEVVEEVPVSVPDKT